MFHKKLTSGSSPGSRVKWVKSVMVHMEVPMGVQMQALTERYFNVRTNTHSGKKCLSIFWPCVMLAFYVAREKHQHILASTALHWKDIEKLTGRHASTESENELPRRMKRHYSTKPLGKKIPSSLHYQKSKPISLDFSSKRNAS